MSQSVRESVRESVNLWFKELHAQLKKGPTVSFLRDLSGRYCHDADDVGLMRMKIILSVVKLCSILYS